LLSGTENLDIQDILLDNQKQVWVATNNGIFGCRQLTFNQPFKELLNQNIRNFSHSGALFFSAWNLVYRLESNEQLYHHYTSKHGEVTALFANDQGLYVGTNKGQIIHKKNDGSSSLLDFPKQGKQA
jgi:ligand-binding sensor domain-containing protein